MIYGLKKMVKNFGEMIAFDGLTIEDMNMLAGGGGKSSSKAGKGPAPETPAPMQSIDYGGAGSVDMHKTRTLNYEDTVDKERAILRKSLGARGLRIPLSNGGSNTKTESSPTTTSVNVSK